MKALCHRVIVIMVVSVLVVIGWGLGQAIAHTAIGGEASIVDVTVTSSASWTTLRTVIVDFTGDIHLHNCAVTASAELANPGAAGENKYVFAVALDTVAPLENDTSARVLEMTSIAGFNDPDAQSIATTKTFANMSAALHTIRFLGKKHSTTPAAANAVSEDSSISIVCTQNLAF